MESENALSFVEKKKSIQLPSAHVGHVIGGSRLAIEVEITVRPRVGPAAVSVSQDPGLDAAVSLISSLYVVSVKKCSEVGAAPASASDPMGHLLLRQSVTPTPQGGWVKALLASYKMYAGVFLP